MELLNNLSEEFTRRTVNKPEWMIKINEGQDLTALPILIESLEEGDVDLAYYYDGGWNLCPNKISKSALTINKLLSVFEIIIENGDNQYIINEIKEVFSIPWI